MKCLCGFNQKPENINTLRSHLDHCQSKGKIPKTKKGYFIVWRDGEFTVVDKTKKNENVFDDKKPQGKPIGVTKKVGLPAYTPTESLLSPKKVSVRTRKKKEDK